VWISFFSLPETAGFFVCACAAACPARARKKTRATRVSDSFTDGTAPGRDAAADDDGGGNDAAAHGGNA
jgi:hypothetical protein